MEITVVHTPRGWRWLWRGSRDRVLAYGPPHRKKVGALADAAELREWLAGRAAPETPAGRYAAARRNRV